MRRGRENPLVLVAAQNLRRLVRNRSFYVLAFIAPLVISAALATTVGQAISRDFRPALVVADELGAGLLDPLVAGLGEAGFDRVEVVADASSARHLVESGEADAAIVFPAALAPAVIDPLTEPPAIVVVGDAGSPVAATVARSIAERAGREFDTVRVLSLLGAPIDDLGGPLQVTQQSTGVRVLTDGTYFTVGIAAYFVFFTATALMATVHRERRQSTMARMLAAPVGRFVPLAGKAAAALVVAALSYVTMMVATTVTLGADWGPITGALVIGAALCFAATGVAVCVAAFTRDEDAAGQIGAVVTTAWAIFGGVFLPLPATGGLDVLTRFSPFRWVLDGIGANAGVASFAEVAGHAAVIGAFGVVALVVAMARHERLGAP